MPQLIPYYFSNQNNISFILITTLVYLFSRFILPVPSSLFTCRIFLFTV